jgi:hypothetical protein
MRIVWKDTAAVRKDFKYRGYWVEGYGEGWVVNLPGDDNIYRTNRCAKNAIDQTLGLEGRKQLKTLPKRLEHGIDIIGKRNDKRLG